MKTNTSSAEKPKEFHDNGALFDRHIEPGFAMNPFNQFRTAILPLLMAFMLGCFGLSTQLLAVVPAPDGGYPGGPGTTFAVIRSCSTTPTTRCSPRIRGSRQGLGGGTASARVAEQLEAAGRPLPSWRRRTIRDRDRGAAGRHRSTSSSSIAQSHEVARDLVGCSLLFDGRRRSDRRDRELRARRPGLPRPFAGFTARTAPLFGPPGRAYVYRSYGIHACLNFVCEPEGAAAAVVDSGARATLGPGGDAPAPRPRGHARAVLRAGEAHRGIRDRFGGQSGPADDGRRSTSGDGTGGGARCAWRPAPGSGSAARRSCRGASARRRASTCRGPCLALRPASPRPRPLTERRPMGDPRSRAGGLAGWAGWAWDGCWVEGALCEGAGAAVEGAGVLLGAVGALSVGVVVVVTPPPLGWCPGGAELVVGAHDLVEDQRRDRAAVDGRAAVLGQHRLHGVGVADPDCDRDVLVRADEPCVAVVLRRPGLAPLGRVAGVGVAPCAGCDHACGGSSWRLPPRRAGRPAWSEPCPGQDRRCSSRTRSPSGSWTF